MSPVDAPPKGYIRGKKVHKDYNLFDLVAGRLRKGQFRRTGDIADGYRTAVAPEDYLTQKHSFLDSYPYAEHPDLPDPSLVYAIHYYMTQRIKESNGEDEFGQYDATALLAIAIEIEEKIKEMIGEDGHLAYARVKKTGL